MRYLRQPSCEAKWKRGSWDIGRVQPAAFFFRGEESTALAPSHITATLWYVRRPRPRPSCLSVGSFAAVRSLCCCPGGLTRRHGTVSPSSGPVHRQERVRLPLPLLVSTAPCLSVLLVSARRILFLSALGKSYTRQTLPPYVCRRSFCPRVNTCEPAGQHLA